MTSTLSDTEWGILLQRIKDRKVTPFLGAGACFGTLPLGADVARDWSRKYKYPTGEEQDLGRVAQFLAVTRDPTFPKEQILKSFKGLGPPDFHEPDEPHGLLADLPLPVYLTTNYDDFMLQALADRNKDARQELCRWNQLLKGYPSIFDQQPGYSPSVAQPLVFHLHGHSRPVNGHSAPESLVLTEDDYLEFLGSMVRDGALLPPPVQQALANTSLLFIGYRLADMNFRVLLQGLRPTMKHLSVVVLVPPRGPAAQRKKMQAYLDRYYGAMQLRVYWGTARAFCGELRQRWKKFNAKV